MPLFADPFFNNLVATNFGRIQSRPLAHAHILSEKFSECALAEWRACVAWIPGDVNTLLAGLRVHIHRFLTPEYIYEHTPRRESSIVIVSPSNKAYWPISRRCSNLSIPAQHNAMFHMCPVCVSLIK